MDQQENGKQLSDEEITSLLQAATKSTIELANFSKHEYQQLFEIISASCLHAINCLY